jgi:hypothetical protein
MPQSRDLTVQKLYAWQALMVLSHYVFMLNCLLLANFTRKPRRKKNKAIESVTNPTLLSLLWFIPFAISFFRKLRNFLLLRVTTFLVRSNTCTITKPASELHGSWQSNNQANY